MPTGLSDVASTHRGRAASYRRMPKIWCPDLMAQVMDDCAAGDQWACDLLDSL
jgi:hypothetical protein